MLIPACAHFPRRLILPGGGGTGRDLLNRLSGTLFCLDPACPDFLPSTYLLINWRESYSVLE